MKIGMFAADPQNQCTVWTWTVSGCRSFVCQILCGCFWAQIRDSKAYWYKAFWKEWGNTNAFARSSWLLLRLYYFDKNYLGHNEESNSKSIIIKRWYFYPERNGDIRWRQEVKTAGVKSIANKRDKTVNERIEIRASLYSDCKDENFLLSYSLKKKSSLIIFPANHQSTLHGFYLLLLPAQWLLKMCTITSLVICSKTLDPVSKFWLHSWLESYRCPCAWVAALHLCAGTQRVQIRKSQVIFWNKTERFWTVASMSCLLYNCPVPLCVYIPLDFYFKMINI